MNRRAKVIVYFSSIVLLVSLFLISIEAARTPGSEGFGSDSMGTHDWGHRALFELLTELKIETRRELNPPPDSLKAGDTLALIRPGQAWTEQAPAYLEGVGKWVNEGGTVIVTAPVRDQHEWRETVTYRSSRQWRHKNSDDDDDKKDEADDRRKSVLELLGLPEVRFVRNTPVEEPKPAETESAFDQLTGKKKQEANPTPGKKEPVTPDSPDAKKVDAMKAAAEREMKLLHETETGGDEGAQTCVVKSGGTLAFVEKEVHMIIVPNITGAIWINRQFGPDPLGTVDVTMPVSGNLKTKVTQTLMAEYAVGKGRVILCSSGGIFKNGLLDRVENAALAAQIFHHAGGRIVFDGFYHGLTVRGNPFWLAGRHPFGLLALMLLISAGLWAWRGSVAPGSSLKESEAPRRTIVEYLDAMSALFLRGDCHHFLLQENMTGTLRGMAAGLGLPHGRDRYENVHNALERRNPALAEKFRADWERATAALNSPTLSARSMAQHSEEITSWLSKT